jgi:hypothetical protein
VRAFHLVLHGTIGVPLGNLLLLNPSKSRKLISQIGDMLEFRSPSLGRKRKFPRGFCIMQYSIRWKPGKSYGWEGEVQRWVPTESVDGKNHHFSVL